MERIEEQLYSIFLPITLILMSFTLGFSFSYQSSQITTYYDFLFRCYQQLILEVHSISFLVQDFFSQYTSPFHFGAFGLQNYDIIVTKSFALCLMALAIYISLNLVFQSLLPSNQETDAKRKKA